MKPAYRIVMLRKIVQTIALLLAATASYAQIDVMPAQTAQALAKKLVGAGVTITNPILTCPTQANGIFNVNGTDLGLDSGVVLTTGRAKTQGNKYGVNGSSFFLASNNDGAPGDPILDGLAGQATHDACALEFDLIPNGDTVKFDYVFSSEEYINATCGPYNDAFGFFISGPGINGQENMALVPGTNIPVTINSINSGVPGPGNSLANCTNMGPGSPFTSYYKDNSQGLLLTHKGLTEVLQAKHAVQPCSTYHLKLVIADGGNYLYDSGVFLRAGSLSITSYRVSALSSLAPLPPQPAGDNLKPYAVKGCKPGYFRIKRMEVKPTPEVIHYIIGGTAVNGVDYTTIPDSVAIPASDSSADITINGLLTPNDSIKTVTLYIEPPFTCTGMQNIVDSATLILYDTMSIHMLTPDTAVCAGDSIALHVDGHDIFNYDWMPQTGLNDPHMKDPIAALQSSTAYLVKASIPGTQCPPSYASINLTVKPTPYITDADARQACMNKPYSLSISVVPDNFNYAYVWTGPNGFASINISPSILRMQQASEGVYHIMVTNTADGCKTTDSFYVKVASPPPPVVVSPVIICQYKQDSVLTANGQNLLWYSSLDSTGIPPAPIPPTIELGTSHYYVSQTVDGCESAKSDIEVAIEKCCDGTIFIPSAFTPNGDGRNDKFRVMQDYGYTIQQFRIYNRWGQTVFDGYGNDAAWDGTYGGQPAAVGEYYYYIKIVCINGGVTERKGDVILIR